MDERGYMSQSRLQIVVISAAHELEDDRRLVCETLVGLGAFVSGFSFPDVSDTDRLKLNQKCLADADYAIVITNLRYAPLTPGGAGFVHQMVAAIQAKNIPMLSLVYKGVHKTILNDDDARRQADFVSLLKAGHYYEWHNAEGLRHATEKAYEKLHTNYPAGGWIKKGTDADSGDGNASVSTDRQIALLKAALADARANKKLEVDNSEVTIDYDCKVFYGGTMKNESGRVNLTWNDIFLALGPQLLNPSRENSVRTVLGDQILEREKASLKRRFPQAHAFVDLRLQTNLFNVIKVNLMAQGLVAMKQGQWQLTALGENHLLRQASSLKNS